LHSPRENPLSSWTSTSDRCALWGIACSSPYSDRISSSMADLASLAGVFSGTLAPHKASSRCRARRNCTGSLPREVHTGLSVVLQCVNARRARAHLLLHAGDHSSCRSAAKGAVVTAGLQRARARGMWVLCGLPSMFMLRPCSSLSHASRAVCASVDPHEPQKTCASTHTLQPTCYECRL
jgi:hypothetical protein